jgi:hypothetical protein
MHCLVSDFFFLSFAQGFNEDRSGYCTRASALILHVSCRSKKNRKQQRSRTMEKQKSKEAEQQGKENKQTNKKQKFRTAKKQRAEKQEKKQKNMDTEIPPKNAQNGKQLMLKRKNTYCFF